MVILSAVFFITTFTTPSRNTKPSGGRPLVPRVKLMAALFLYVAVFQVLGFIVSTFLLLVYLFKGLEPQSWRNALLLSAVTIAICYLVFGVFWNSSSPGVLSFIRA